MTKLNPKATLRTEVVNEPTRTKNYEGGVAFTLSDKTRLYTRVATCLVGESKFYKEIDETGIITAENQDNLLLKDLAIVAEQDPEFVLKLAAYARNDLYLRSVPVVMLVEASLNPKTKPFVRHYAPWIIQRVDELTETTAYLQAKIGNIGNKSPKGSMPAGLKKGLADSFHNFNEYQFGKYDREGLVKLKDVLKITHPVPRNEEESALFSRIKTRTLKTPETWEVVISTKGSTKEIWESIIPKMPYMAILRNCRNFLEKKVSQQSIDLVVSKLTNENAVRKSKQFPFRFFSAYRELENIDSPYTSQLLTAVEAALEISVANLPHFAGTTFETADNSGSMGGLLSERGTVKREDIANLFMAISVKMADRSVSSIFGTSFKVKNFAKNNGIIANMRSIRNDEVGSNTNAYLSFDYLLENKLSVDRIILFSDMQCYDSRGDGRYGSSVLESFRKYKRSVNPNVYLYSIDLAGYGTAQVPENEPRVATIAGWTERILTFIPAFEAGLSNPVMEKIESFGKAPAKQAEEED